MENAHRTVPFVRQLQRNFLRERYLHLIIMLPVVYLLIFHYYPMYGAQIAFRNFAASRGIWASPWVGLRHFVRFFQSPVFARVVPNTIVLSIYGLAAGFPVPILLALALNSARSRMFKKSVQMITYAPYFISTVVLVGMMYQFFSPKLGVVNNLIRVVGGSPVLFMGSLGYFRHMYVWSGVWQSAGWGSIIYLAALSSIDPTLYEAAVVDGASRFRRLWHIDLPGIRPTMIILLILNVGQVMTIGFEKAFLMQNPANIANSEIIATYVYKIGFVSGLPNYSYAAAIGLLNSIVNLVLLVGVNRLARTVTETSLW